VIGFVGNGIRELLYGLLYIKKGIHGSSWNQNEASKSEKGRHEFFMAPKIGSEKRKRAS
jgi:hypothetical protein